MSSKTWKPLGKIPSRTEARRLIKIGVRREKLAKIHKVALRKFDAILDSVINGGGDLVFHANASVIERPLSEKKFDELRS